MIKPGTPQQIEWGKGNWIFLDMGFSRTQKTYRRRRAVLRYFPEAQRRILDHLAGARSITNLMIEAPLSVSFRNGRPAPRSVERRDGKNRFWYVGAGCAVMVASMYLLKAIDFASPPCGVRLFEALISYKDQEARTDHMKRNGEGMQRVTGNAIPSKSSWPIT